MAITNSPRLGIERWSHGTDRHPPRAVWDAQQAILDDLVAIDRQYATLADRPAAGVRGTYCWVEATGVLYRDDGSQWRPIVQFGGGAGAAVVVGGSGAEGTSARTARADHSHPLPLATASAHGAMRREDKAKLDGATSAATASTLAQRDSAGGAAFSAVTASAAPSTAAHLTRRDYVDGLVGGVHVPTTIPSGANLDAYTTSGVYVQNQHTSAQAGSNYPVPYAGLLTVHASSGLVFQEYTATNLNPGLDRNAAWRRTRYNGAWGGWEQSPTARYVDEVAGAARFAGQLDGTDLDEVLDPGLYGLNAQANATTALNYPAEGIGGTLLVMRWAGASGSGRAVTQLYQGRGARSRNRVWIRSKITATSSFSPWVELANTDLATSSSDGLMPRADKALLDTATESATNNALVRRNAVGGAFFSQASATMNAPTEARHLTRKDYVDAGDAAAQSGAEATAAAALAPVKDAVDSATSIAATTGSRLVRRDASGRYRAQDPIDQYDVANRRYADGLVVDRLQTAITLSGEDLDTITAEGVYRKVGTADIGNPALHYPPGSAGAGALLVTKYSTSGVIQEWTSWGGGVTSNVRRWIRNSNDSGGAWTGWRELAGTEAATSSSAGLMPAGDRSALNSATNLPTGGALAKRDTAGRLRAADPVAASDVANMGFVQSAASSAQSAAEATAAAALAPVKTTVDNATASATASRLVQRDSAGRARFNDPSNVLDAANKRYVDAEDSALAARLAAAEAELSALTTNYGTKFVNMSTGAVPTYGTDVNARIGVRRIGNMVTVSVVRFHGQVSRPGFSGGHDLHPDFTLPPGLRPEESALTHNVIIGGGGVLRISADGVFRCTESNHTYPNAGGGTLTYPVTSPPPTTWGAYK